MSSTSVVFLLTILTETSGVTPDSEQRPHFAKSMRAAYRHLKSNDLPGAARAATNALRAQKSLEELPSMLSPAIPILVATDPSGQALFGLREQPCRFETLALSVHRELAAGEWRRVEVQLKNIEAKADACGRDPKDPYRSDLLLYLSWVRFVQGDKAGADKLARQATSFRQRAVVQDRFLNALLKTSSKTNDGCGDKMTETKRWLRAFRIHEVVCAAVAAQP